MSNAVDSQLGSVLSQVATISQLSTHAFSPSNYKQTTSATGNPVVKGLRVFKEGTFTSMEGNRATWESVHLDQMVSNYNFLRQESKLVDVPWRKDHTRSIEDIVGYCVDLYRDPADPSFLLTDLEWTSPEDFESWQQGKFRARSAEVGLYQDNDQTLYFPVVLGVAFVDIGGVEGLYAKENTSSMHVHAIFDQEGPVTGTNDTGKSGAGDNAPATIDGMTPKEWEVAANYAKALEDAQNESWLEAANFAKAIEDLGIDPTTVRPAPTPDGTSHSFSVNGVTTTDINKVQQHINTLEKYQRESIANHRKDFITQLAAEGKILPAQTDSFSSLVESMTVDQFNDFKSSYEAVESSLFSRHGGTGGERGEGSGEGNQEPDEVEALREIVAHHRASGIPEDQLQTISSFKKLMELTDNKG